MPESRVPSNITDRLRSTPHQRETLAVRSCNSLDTQTKALVLQNELTSSYSEATRNATGYKGNFKKYRWLQGLSDG